MLITENLKKNFQKNFYLIFNLTYFNKTKAFDSSKWNMLEGNY